MDVRKIQAGRKILQPKPHPRRANDQLQSLTGAMSRRIGASREAPLPWERLFPREKLFLKERPAAPSAPAHPSALGCSVLGRVGCSFFLNILSWLSRRKTSLFYAKSTHFPRAASNAHTKTQRWGSHGMFPQLVRGLSQKGDTRPKVVSNRTAWTGENHSSLMGILLVSDPKSF